MHGSRDGVSTAAALPAAASQLTAEALFLEATGRLVGAAPGVLSPQQGADLEAVAFDWLLGADAYLSYPDPYHHKDRASLLLCTLSNAHVGPGHVWNLREAAVCQCAAWRIPNAWATAQQAYWPAGWLLGYPVSLQVLRRALHSPPSKHAALRPLTGFAHRVCPVLRLQVVLAASQMLGALSPLRLTSITQRWGTELNKLIRADSNSPARQLLYDLCHGMRFVRLAGGTPAQLEASAEFLRLTHPLTHVAPDKKSRVQQAICDMLAGVLQPLADGGNPE